MDEEGRRIVFDRLQEDIRNGDLTLEQAKRELAETPGMTVGDLGPGLRDLTDTLAQTPGPAGRGIRKTLTDRNKQQWKRIFPKLSEAIGAEDNFAIARRELVRKMRDDAETNYGEAYQTPIRLTARMRELFSTDSGKAALKEGKALRRELEKNPKALDMKGAMQSTRDMDYMLQAYDDVVSGLYRKGKGQRATAAKANRNELRQLLYSANPAYQEARRAWAGDMANNNAMDKGLRLFTDDADITAEVIRDMSDSEKMHFKIGNLRAIARKLGNKSDTSDITKGIFDSENKRQAVTLAFGGRKQFDDFMDFIEREQKMFNNYKEATQNTKTAKYLTAGVNPGGRLAQILGYTLALKGGGGELARATGYGAQKLHQMVSPAAARAAREEQLTARQSGLLMGTDIEALAQPRTMGGLLATGAQPSVGAGVGGLLAAGQPGLQPEPQQ